MKKKETKNRFTKNNKFAKLNIENITARKFIPGFMKGRKCLGTGTCIGSES